jgi:hypothetical protein
MKSFYVFLTILILLITLFVINNTKNDNKNVSVLDGSRLTQDGSLILKNGDKVDLNKK